MTAKSKTELAESLGDHLNLLKLHHQQNFETDHAVNSIFSAMDKLINQVYEDSLSEINNTLTDQCNETEFTHSKDQ